MSRLKNSATNKAFKKAHSGAKLPPDFILYESFGKLNYDRYYNGGQETAQWLVDIIGNYHDLNNTVVCEWGCGPGRIIRHLPGILKNKGCTIIGTDYNHDTIEWDKNNLKGISFFENRLAPPLPFETGSIDVLYAISVFTHLSEQMHYAWLEELMRVLKLGGILLFTTHGDSFKDKLMPVEIKLYEEGMLVERSHSTEGKRTYAAFHSPVFVKKLLSNYRLLAHLENTEPQHQYNQDFWIAGK